MQAKKKFGQNFISDSNLINKIINVLGEEKDQLVIEIGPGTGALTTQLVKKFNQVIAIEIDTDLEIILKDKIKDSNFHLIMSDVLEINFDEVINKYKTNEIKKVSIISNMPYYITSEILFKVFDCSNINFAVFMMQKEVATRLCANKGENNYNNLSIAAEFYATKKYEFTVNKGMFRPIPKVDSAIVSLDFDKKLSFEIHNDKEFIKFVRKLFNNKRKTILNNLTQVTGDKVKAQLKLDEIGLLSNLRPEQIGLDDFVKLYKSLK